MLAIERRNDILERLQADKRVVVSELSAIYQVSEETIRRDLEKLENDGLVIKSYGGAVLNEHSIFDLPFNIRKNQKIVEKEKIARLIAGMVRDGEALMLDASSTDVYIAKALKRDEEAYGDHQFSGDYRRTIRYAGMERHLYRRDIQGEVFCLGWSSYGCHDPFLPCG